MNLKELFSDLQKKMQGEIGLGPFLDHPGEQGSLTEDSWITWLRDYLPSRYRVDKAKVVDCHGEMSDQIDIVVYDRHYSPMIFEVLGKKIIPAESVYCVFEVKPEINRQYIQYAADKIESVRNLERTSDKVPWAGGIVTSPQKPFRILGGLLTTRCEWVEKLHSPAFSTVMKEIGQPPKIDIGCSLLGGSFWSEDNRISFGTPDESLLVFYLELLKKLRVLGTVPAIKYDAYSGVLKTYKEKDGFDL